MARTKLTARKSTAGMVPQVSIVTQQKVEEEEKKREEEFKDPRNWRPGGKFGPLLPAKRKIDDVSACHDEQQGS